MGWGGGGHIPLRSSPPAGSSTWAGARQGNHRGVYLPARCPSPFLPPTPPPPLPPPPPPSSCLLPPSLSPPPPPSPSPHVREWPIVCRQQIARRPPPVPPAPSVCSRLLGTAGLSLSSPPRPHFSHPRLPAPCWGRRAGRSRQPAGGEPPPNTRGTPAASQPTPPRCGWRGGRGRGGHPRPPAGVCFRRRSRKEGRMGMKDAGRGGCGLCLADAARSEPSRASSRGRGLGAARLCILQPRRASGFGTALLRGLLVLLP